MTNPHGCGPGEERCYVTCGPHGEDDDPCACDEVRHQHCDGLNIFWCCNHAATATIIDHLHRWLRTDPRTGCVSGPLPEDIRELLRLAGEEA